MVNEKQHTYLVAIPVYDPGSGKGRYAAFKNLIIDCIQNRYGLCLIVERTAKIPSALLGFGSVWSYAEYGHLGGCGNVRDDFEKAFSISRSEPLTAVVSEDNNIMIGRPSDDFFPPYVRDMLSSEIKKHKNPADPEYNLVTTKKYAMPYSIGISVGHNATHEEKINIRRCVDFYMPPYLPAEIL